MVELLEDYLAVDTNTSQFAMNLLAAPDDGRQLIGSVHVVAIRKSLIEGIKFSFQFVSIKCYLLSSIVTLPLGWELISS